MVVDQIVDVVEEAVKVRKKSGRPGLLGSAVVGKQVTDFLDLNAVIRASAGNWEEGAEKKEAGKIVLVADSSNFSRSMIRGGLEMAGYAVLEAANLDDAVRKLEQQPIDVVPPCLRPCAVVRTGVVFRCWRCLTRPIHPVHPPHARQDSKIALRSWITNWSLKQ
jgi:hypothetical protein